MDRRLRVLYLAPRPPWPADSGAPQRAQALIRALTPRCDVTVLALAPPGPTPPPPADLDAAVHLVPHAALAAPRALALAAGALRGEPYALARYRSRTFARAVAAHAREADLVIAGQLHVAPYLDPRRPSLLDAHNVESEVWRRLAARAHGPRALALALQAAWLERFERRAAAAAGVVTCCSARDQAWFEAAGQPRARLVPNGVDTGRVVPAPGPCEPAHLLFIGSLDWAPNDDGLRRFHARVWPRLRAARPDLTLSVVGHGAGPALRALARRDPSFRLVGRVDDVRPWLERATLVVVPLYAGGGTRLKLLEAFAAGKAVVATPLAAEGLDVRHGGALLLPEDDAGFAAEVLRALDDAPLRERLAATARAHVVAHHDWSAIAEPWLAAVEEAVAVGPRRAARGGRAS